MKLIKSYFAVCSFCIRKHCTLQNCCPICNTELSDRMLKANHILDEIIKSFLSIKKFFLQSNTEEPTPGSPKRKSLVIGTKLDTPSKLPKTRVEEQQASNQSVNVEATTSIAQTPVLCPICNTSVVNNMINSHLDSCMKASSPQKRAPVRDPMPKLIYNLMTKKDLCKKLKLVGLSQQGDMGTLIQRHRKFTTLYNAECDNTRPRSDAELVRQIEKEEAAGKKLAQQQQLQQQQPRRRLEPEAADKWNRQYLEENRLQFQKLIDEIRQRRTVTAEDRQEVPIETEDDEVSILPHAPKVVEEISLIEDEEPTDQSSTEEKRKSHCLEKIDLH